MVKRMKKYYKFANHLKDQGYEAFAIKLAQAADEAFIAGPDVQIDPSIKGDVQSAVDELRKTDPSFFKGVSKVVGITSSAFGEVQSTDPTVIHINLPKIKQKIQSDLGSQYNPSDPKHKDLFKEALKRAIVETISHEKGHVKDYNPEQGKFPGGEGVAEQSEKEMMQKLKYDEPLRYEALRLFRSKSFKLLTAKMIRKYESNEVASDKYFAQIKHSAKSMRRYDYDLTNLDEFLDKLDDLTQYLKKPLDQIEISDLKELYHRADSNREASEADFDVILANHKEVKELIDYYDKIEQDPEQLKEAYLNKDKLNDLQLKILYQALVHGQSANLVPNLLLDPDLVWRKLGEKIQNRIQLEKESSSLGQIKIAILTQKVNPKTNRKEWVLVSRKDRKPLKYFGPEKPSEERVKKEEQRIQYFKHKASLNDISLSKYAKRLSNPNSFVQFEKELAYKVGNTPLIKIIDSYSKTFRGDHRFTSIVMKRASANNDSKVVPTIEALLKVFDEILTKSDNPAEHLDFDWYDKYFKIIDKYIKKVESEWEMLVSHILSVKSRVEYFKKMLPDLSKMSLNELDNKIKDLTEKASTISDHQTILAHLDMLHHSISKATSQVELSPLLFSPNHQIRSATKKRYEELSNKKEEI